MMPGALDRSIEELESKIAYLEHAMGELSDVVFRQRGDIQALESAIGQLRDRLEASQVQGGPSGSELERPPHY